MSDKTRDEHIEWCKERALEYVDRGELSNAMASMGSDLEKHPETEKHPGIQMGIMMLVGGMLSSDHEMRKFIDGFH